MKIEACAAVPLWKVKMQVSSIDPHSGDLHQGLVFANDWFGAFLPSEIIAQIKVGDYLEIICIPTSNGRRTERVLQVKRSKEGNQPFEMIGCANGAWENLLEKHMPK